MTNTNWKENETQSLFFVEVSVDGNIVKIYKWYSTDNQKAVSEVFRYFNTEIPKNSYIHAYQGM